MDTALRLVRNSIFSSLSSVLTKIANTLVFILVARKLAVDELGIYSLALTYSIIFMQLASWGLDQLLVREVARHKDRVVLYLNNFLLIRVILSVLTYGLLMLVVTRGILYQHTTVNILLLVGVTIVLDGVSNICQAIFIAFEQLAYITYISLATSLFKLGMTWIGLQTTGGLPLLSGIIVGVSLVGSILSFIIVYRRFVAPINAERGSVREKITVRLWPDWLNQAFPFIFISLFYTLDYHLDSVLLSVWQGERDVGLYGAATTIVFATTFIPQAFREAMFPVMSRLHPVNPSALRRLYIVSTRWLLALALPIIFGGVLVAGELMSWLYKDNFHESARILQIVIWVTLFLFLNVPNNRLMIVAGRQRELAWFVIVSMCTNLLLNGLLIPRWGVIGISLTRLLSSALFFVLTYTYTYRHLIRFNLLSVLPRPLAASMIMGTVIGVSVRFIPLPFVIGLSVGVYFLSLWLVGFITGEERAVVKQFVNKFNQWRTRWWAG